MARRASAGPRAWRTWALASGSPPPTMSAPWTAAAIWASPTPGSSPSCGWARPISAWASTAPPPARLICMASSPPWASMWPGRRALPSCSPTPSWVPAITARAAPAPWLPLWPAGRRITACTARRTATATFSIRSLSPWRAMPITAPWLPMSASRSTTRSPSLTT